MKLFTGILLAIFLPFCLIAQNNPEERSFEQMGTTLPTPNSYRNASGAPGEEYWQQQADYQMELELDEEKHTITGYEIITYHNNSPDRLNYLWLQLEQNIRNAHSDTYSTATSEVRENMNSQIITSILGHGYDLGYHILEVKNMSGIDLPYTINKTMMRVDMKKPISPDSIFSFTVRWYYNINDRMKVRGRSGMEYFEEDDNYLYSIAQFFPRMAVYDDINGWQNKQFLGQGEFTLPFGNYKVSITVPSDHIIGATGVLQNQSDVLTSEQIELFEKAKNATEPVIIVSEDEVIEKEKQHATDKKTWIYKADSVRDFAFVSSRKFIWDAMGVDVEGNHVMAMSYYPKEANPLYEEYSTRVVAHTIKTYSKYTIPYVYPVAISVEAANGMEYPMICFNYGRPNKDGTYSERLKRGMISVIIHEVGHNFFPMIINSDERQWTWMDEGLNSFVQYLTEKEWDPNYPSRRGPVENIVPYMKGSKDTMVPIMTNSEQLKQFGNNGYAKPATALNILRETIMGHELFDYAFKEYCNRWAFKHPSPADFFRTMEDASAIDLDWFWKGWFYTTDNVDLSIEDVTFYKYHDELASNMEKKGKSEKKKKNQHQNTRTYSQHGYNDGEEMSPEEKLKTPNPITTSLNQADVRLKDRPNFYEIELANKGGLVMPVILKFNFEDGSSEIVRLPAEIWRMNEKEVTKSFAFEKEVISIELDPNKETADVNEYDNHFPPKDIPSKFDEFKKKNR